MSLGPILNVASVLDLRVDGALGTFSVTPAAPDSPSIPVKYIQTHITFDLDGGHKERLFQNLFVLELMVVKRQLIWPTSIVFFQTRFTLKNYLPFTSRLE